MCALKAPHYTGYLDCIRQVYASGGMVNLLYTLSDRRKENDEVRKERKKSLWEHSRHWCGQREKTVALNIDLRHIVHFQQKSTRNEFSPFPPHKRQWPCLAKLKVSHDFEKVHNVTGCSFKFSFFSVLCNSWRWGTDLHTCASPTHDFICLQEGLCVECIVINRFLDFFFLFFLVTWAVVGHVLTLK